MLAYSQAILLGALQGVTGPSPVSSLGHGVIIPARFGWHNPVAAESAPESYYPAFVVVLHAGTPLGLFVYFRDEWFRIIPAFFRTLAKRRIETPDERMAWLLGIATIPSGSPGWPSKGFSGSPDTPNFREAMVIAPVGIVGGLSPR